MPDFFRATRGGVNAFGVAAGKSAIVLVADEQDGERASGNGFFRGDFVSRKSCDFGAAVDERPRAGSEKGFAQPGISAEAGVVVGGFGKAGESSFGDNGFDARIRSGGLQRDARAHGFAEGEDVIWQWARRSADSGPLDRNTGINQGRNESVDDGAGVVAFEVAVGGDGALARSVSAGVHHENAVSGAQQNARVLDHSNPIIGYTVKDEHPGAVRILGDDFPATEQSSIGRADVKIRASRTDGRKGDVGFANEAGSELPADGVEESRAGKPAANGREQRREQ